MKTMRRDRLLRLAKAGKLIMVSSYYFDDMHGSMNSGSELPVKVIEVGDNRPEGFACIYESDFQTNSGRAWVNPNGTITLIVHSNCNYDFRIVEK